MTYTRSNTEQEKENGKRFLDGRQKNEMPWKGDKGMKSNRQVKVGWRNVHSLNATGALDLLLHDVYEHRLELLGICEVRWPGTGCLTKMVNGEKYTIHYCGDKWRREFGVGVVLNRWASTCLDAIGHIDRTMMWARLKMAENQGVTFIICHAPTQDKCEEDIDEFYGRGKRSCEKKEMEGCMHCIGRLQSVVNEVKSRDLIVVLGDFNAQVGREREGWEGRKGEFTLSGVVASSTGDVFCRSDRTLWCRRKKCMGTKVAQLLCRE
jgi:hypothetical protein